MHYTQYGGSNLFRTTAVAETPKGCCMGESVEFLRYIVQMHLGGILFGKKVANPYLSYRIQCRNPHVVHRRERERLGCVYIYIHTYT